MPNYKRLYFALAARVADAVELLIGALQRGEDTYADDDHPAITALPPVSPGEDAEPNPDR